VSLKTESFLPRTEHEESEGGGGGEKRHPYIVLAVTDGDPPSRPLEFSPWNAVRIEGKREGAHTSRAVKVINTEGVIPHTACSVLTLSSHNRAVRARARACGRSLTASWCSTPSPQSCTALHWAG
jgi:hypothetical protein